MTIGPRVPPHVSWRRSVLPSSASKSMRSSGGQSTARRSPKNGGNDEIVEPVGLPRCASRFGTFSIPETEITLLGSIYRSTDLVVHYLHDGLPAHGGACPMGRCREGRLSLEEP